MYTVVNKRLCKDGKLNTSLEYQQKYCSTDSVQGVITEFNSFNLLTADLVNTLKKSGVSPDFFCNKDTVYLYKNKDVPYIFNNELILPCEKEQIFSDFLYWVYGISSINTACFNSKGLSHYKCIFATNHVYSLYSNYIERNIIDRNVFTVITSGRSSDWDIYFKMSTIEHYSNFLKYLTRHINVNLVLGSKKNKGIILYNELRLKQIKDITPYSTVISLNTLYTCLTEEPSDLKYWYLDAYDYLLEDNIILE